MSNTLKTTSTWEHEKAIPGEVLNQATSSGGQVTHSFNIAPARVAKGLLFVATFLLGCHLTVVHLGFKLLGILRHTDNYATYEHFYYGFYEQFHLGLEGNISTYFSVLNLAFASFLLLLVYNIDKKSTIHWLYLSALFLFLSIDEYAQIHEKLGGMAGHHLNTLMGEVPPFLSWAWMLPYTLLVLVLGLYFFRFTTTLPFKTRNLFYLSGGVFVFAALGMEFLESHFDVVYGAENQVNKYLFPCEEMLEMTGIILFIYALLDYVKMKTKAIQLLFIR